MEFQHWQVAADYFSTIAFRRVMPNPAVNQTCAKSRAGRLILRWASLQVVHEGITE